MHGHSSDPHSRLEHSQSVELAIMKTRLEISESRYDDIEARLRSVEKQIWIAFGAAGVLNFVLTHFIK